MNAFHFSKRNYSVLKKNIFIELHGSINNDNLN